MKKVEIAAQALIEARENNQPLIDFPENSAPASIKEAFAIQDAILLKTGEQIGAWKVGPASDVFPPTCAAIARKNLFSSPAELPSSLRLKAVECEVAFRLNMDLPVDGGPYSSTEVRGALASAMVAIEAVETRYNEWPVKEPIWALADSQSNEALILGGEVTLEEFDDFSNLKATLSIGKMKKNADKGFPGGDPFSLISWLANHLGTRGSFISERGLKKGDIITTGSWNGVDFAKAREPVVANFLGLGEVKLEYR